MNVGQLIAHLQMYPQYFEVVMTKNMNGDCFSPVEKIGESCFIPWTEVPFDSKMGELKIVDRKKNNCVFLIPEA